MVTQTFCASRAGGENQVLLVGFDGSAWTRHGDLWSYNDTASCVYPRREDGYEHIVCAISHGQQGCYDTELDSPRGLPQQRLPLGADRDCAGREMRDLRVEDVDGDGDEDILVVVDATSHVLRQDGDAFLLQGP